jgi:CBS domain-containing protein
MIERISLSFHGAGSAVLEPTQDPPQWFYLIKQGVVVVEPVEEKPGEDIPRWQLVEGECFPLGSLLMNRPVVSVYRAAEDTFCYRLPAPDFHELLALSPVFQDFCTRRIAHLLDQSQKVVQAQYAQRSVDYQSLGSRLSDVLRREPVTCPAYIPIRAALEKMQTAWHRLRDRDGKTERPSDLHAARPAAHHRGRSDTGRPISRVMTRSLITLPRCAGLRCRAVHGEARHPPRAAGRGRRLVGIISEKDLFSCSRWASPRSATPYAGRSR